MPKYYLYIVNNQKSIELANSTSKTELREKGLEKIGEKIKKYDGLHLYRVSVNKVTKKDIAQDSQNKIKLIGGPWVASIERILISIPKGKTDDKVILKGLGEEGTKIYWGNDYFLKNKIDEPTNESVGKLIWDYVHNKFNTNLFAVNVINK